MNLSQLFKHKMSLDKNQTDKGTTHNYIDGYYNQKFTPRQDDSINLLEIGVFHGLSISLWSNFFSNATIYAIDSAPRNLDVLNSLTNIKLYKLDGYSQQTLDLFEDRLFDFIIDDGPHTLESQIYAAKEWSKKLKVGGALIIEDIQSETWISSIKNAAPSNFEPTVYDLRKDKNRYDDIIIEFVRKS